MSPELPSPELPLTNLNGGAGKILDHFRYAV
jgi:hypothetical protein